MSQNSGDKTEQPTGKRLKESRDRGQIARSRDLVQVASLCITIWVVASQGPGTVHHLGQLIARSIRSIEVIAGRDLDTVEIVRLLLDGTWAVTTIVSPVAMAAVLSIFAFNIVQGGWLFAPESLKLDWSRLSPATGFQRLAPSRAGLDLAKVLLITTVLAVIATQAVTAMTAQSLMLARIPPMQSAWLGWDAAWQFLKSAAVAMATVAAGDYAIQRWRLNDSLKMTKGEVRDDTRLSEGNPETKARVRRVQRELQKRRMLRDTRKATLVITNPTHYAVALIYDRSVMAAPRVVAKGKGVLAARIKAIALEHGIPIVENVPLARALHQSVEVGETIPGTLFKAVAEVLSYLIKLKRLSL